MSHALYEPPSWGSTLPTPPPAFMSWLCRTASHVRLSRVLILLVISFVLLPFAVHYYLSGLAVGADGDVTRRHALAAKLDRVASEDGGIAAMLQQVDELKSIKVSVQTELRELESKRQRVLSEMSEVTAQVDRVRSQQGVAEQQLHQLQLSITATRREQEDIAAQHWIRPPHQLSAVKGKEMGVPVAPTVKCHMDSCFDMSRCPITGGLRVYLYPTDTMPDVDAFVALSVRHVITTNLEYTDDPDAACIYVVVIGDTTNSGSKAYGRLALEPRLHRLSHWHGDGRNHIVLNLARHYISTSDPSVRMGRAILAQSAFTEQSFREGFDMVLPPSLGASHGDVWRQLVAVSPARRETALSYHGQLMVRGKPADLHHPATSDHMSLETDVISALKAHVPADVKLVFSCDTRVRGVSGDWALCDSDDTRQSLLRSSTFALILAPVNRTLVSTLHFQVRFYEALKTGAIPVVLGANARMPFSELLDWRACAIILPRARAPELHFYLGAQTDADILSLRQWGRHVWQTHFGTTAAIVDTLLATLRQRLHLAAPPVIGHPSRGVFNGSLSPPRIYPVQVETGNDDVTIDDALGPLEAPFASPTYTRNFSHDPEMMSRPGDPFHTYPHTPFTPVIPAEAKFTGSSYGFRPIANGEGGAGKEFVESLGGNMPREQFTVVILTYKREAVLMSAISRLKSLPYLNRVVVVWNNPSIPQSDLRWPDIGVPVNVIKTAKNSLNNRFLPYDVIETEAILSLDDDAHLRHDEIMFGFRVWREARDRIVGFPGRFVSWDAKNNNWLYNSNYSCELSMVLTGAAFYHKYYAYLYSYVMPQAIRDKVDEYMNCEDLAMNFLISHVTRKPPFKVTSRWTFRCPGCANALYMDDGHFAERHRCVQFLTQVYGYMPLLQTQFRLDSVLFKTRIPHDKLKCFKFL